jgi:uncharacterized protein with HEPN domain
MKRDVALYVADIVDNMRAATTFVEGMSFDDFVADRKTAYAVVRCLEIIGEAAKNVPDYVRALRPDVPWKDMAGMRDRCVHGYFGVRYETVWATVRQDMAPLRPMLQSLLDELRSGGLVR